MINLLRNREVLIYFAALFMSAFIAALSAVFLEGNAAVFVMILAVLFMVFCSVFFTAKRYLNIGRLSDSLRKISADNYNLDLLRYTEGELSILYDELNKIIRVLSNQAAQLKKDKLWLADTLADISHQLKTPLTSVIMFAEMLNDDNLPLEKRKEFLTGVTEGIERINSLSLALLKLSRLDAKSVIFHMETVSACSVLERSLEPLKAIINNKQITVNIESADLSITCDAYWFSEALTNLLKNALEHTPEKGLITVNCKENPLFTLLTIKDSGPGIPVAELSLIFERFYRGKTASKNSVGIGLNLSKSIINSHNGIIEAKNHPRGGAVFMVKLYHNYENSVV